MIGSNFSLTLPPYRREDGIRIWSNAKLRHRQSFTNSKNNDGIFQPSELFEPRRSSIIIECLRRRESFNLFLFFR